MEIIKPKLISPSINNIVKNYLKDKVKVHSIFRQVFNIQVGKRLICIGYSEINMSTFGLVIDKDKFLKLANRINMDTVVTLNSDEIKFADKFIISISISVEPQKRYCDKHLINIDKLNENIKFLKSLVLINNWKCGFELSFSSIVEGIEVEESDFKEFNKKVNCVLNVKYINEEKSREFLEYFLGRGNGLTPSGDDLIIGMLIVYSHFNIEIKEFKDILKKFIDQKPYKTTKISREYIFYALENEFSPCLGELIFSLLYKDKSDVLKRVIDIKKFGSTSPIDTIIGIIIGAYSVRRGYL